jgi:hypothetical protein
MGRPGGRLFRFGESSELRCGIEPPFLPRAVVSKVSGRGVCEWAVGKVFSGTRCLLFWFIVE